MFEFTTDFGVEYRVYFSNAEGYFTAFPSFSHLVKAFGFDILSNPNTRIPLDPNVPTTIASIVHHYFDRSPQSVLFFFLNNADGKQNGRRKTFDSWFRHFGQDWLLKRDATIPIGRSQIFCSIVLQPTHPLIAEILEGFDLLAFDAVNKPED